MAASNIESGSTYLTSQVGNTVNPDFQGGTLQFDSAANLSQNFTLENDDTNTIDAHGYAGTFGGYFTGTGPITFTDSVGGGSVTLTNTSNTYSGATTINSGATLALSGSGAIASSSSVTDNGIFDISQTTSGASIIALAGAGNVALGAQTLTVTAATGTFSGVVSGTGSLVVNSGTQILTGANTYTGGTTLSGSTLAIGNGGTGGSIAGDVVDNAGTLEFNRSDTISYGGAISGSGQIVQLGGGTLTLTGTSAFTGATTISAGTLALSGSGSIAASSNIVTTGIFDISGTSSGASIMSLSGAGTVQLGGQTLTFTGASGTFSGIIAGSGDLVLSGGTEILSGANSYTGTTTVNGGTLEFAGNTVNNNIIDNAAFGFNSTNTVIMNGVVSGSGGLVQLGQGVSILTAVQTYTGTTTISGGILALSGSGSIAASGDVLDNATFSIAATSSGASILSLDGTGAVQLGTQYLTLTGALGTFSGSIAGTGGLVLGHGVETLSGDNTFTGTTTITAGTLYVAGTNSLASSARVIDNAILDISTIASGPESDGASASIVSLSGNGAVHLGTKTLVLTNAADTFSGIISGSGGVTLSGGQETLSSANTYTGTTSISGGTLALSAAGSLSASSTLADNGTFDLTAGQAITLASLSGSGTVKLGANNLTLANATDIFSGTITGSGQLTVSGGNEVLSGTNSYTGGTVIASGAGLQIGNGFSGGTIAGNVADSGVLAFNRPDSAVFSGAISGAGSVTQIGAGITILTAANLYTGGTTISAGTLQIGNGGTSGSISGNVTDNGILAFGRSDTTGFSGVISGSGGVAQVSGTTLLPSVETYSGATTINSGATLVLAGAGSIASSAVTDNGTFDVSGTTSAPQVASLAGAGTVSLGSQTLSLSNASGNFSGQITGTGGLTVSGGVQTLSGTNAYTGATTVNGGTLAVSGSIASSSGVTVNSGGTLSGTGAVSGVTVNSGGTLAPGLAGGGALHVSGTASLASGSSFLVAVNGTSAPQLIVSGAETLAGTLNVGSVNGQYPFEQKFTVLTASGGITGSFTPGQVLVAGSGADYAPVLTYDADNVYLQVTLSKLSPSLPAGASPNQVDPVAGIDAAITAGETLPLSYENLGLVSSATLATDASQLSGEIGSDVSQTGKALFDPFMTAIFDHVVDEPHGAPQTRFWASGFGGTSRASGDADAGSHDLRSDVVGLVAGGDWSAASNVTLGAAISAGAANFRVAQGAGSGRTDAFQVGLYGLIQYTRRLYGSFAGAFALDKVTTNRVLTVSGTDDLSGKVSGQTFGGRYETGADLKWLTPYVAVEDRLFRSPAYNETATSGASDFALDYDSHSINAANFEVGARQLWNLNLEGLTLKLSDRLAWAYDMSATPSVNAAFVGLPASTFTVYGARTAKNAALISLGADLENRHGFGLNLRLDSAVGANSQTYTGFAGVNFAW